MDPTYLIGGGIALVFLVGLVFVWRRSKKGDTSAHGGVHSGGRDGPRSGGNPVP